MLEKIFYRVQIILLASLMPTLLFNKINRLTWYKNTLRIWADDQRFGAHSKVLEVGCASGILTEHLASTCRTAVGVDYSAKMIEVAKFNHSEIDFLVANVLDLPFADNFFDNVIAASVLNIVEDKVKAVSEIFRTCKKGGVVSVLVPLAGFSDLRLDLLQTSLKNTKFSSAAMNAWHRLAPKMNVNEITSLFKQTGLIQIATKPYLQGMVIAVSATKPF